MFHDVKYTFHDAKHKTPGAAGTFSARGGNFFRQEQGLFPPAFGDFFSRVRRLFLPQAGKGPLGQRAEQGLIFVKLFCIS